MSEDQHTGFHKSIEEAAMSGEPAERDGCHPYDEKCGGPGGPCRNHGGVVEPTERDVEALVDRLRRAFWDPDNGGQWEKIAAAILASDWYAERIAEARREGAADELEKQADGIPIEDHHCFKAWCPHCAMRKTREQQRDRLRDRIAALRGDA